LSNNNKGDGGCGRGVALTAEVGWLGRMVDGIHDMNWMSMITAL